MKKLRNKTTGQVGVLGIHNEEFWVDVSGTRTNDYSLPDPGAAVVIKYSSLPKLAEEWEDYEEPKDYYYISDFGAIRECEIGKFPEDEEYRKAIGNYFLSREETEEAVEKIKALTRLSNKGFKFDGYELHYKNGDLCGQIFYNAGGYCREDVEKDLDLLFGGEE